MTSFDRTNDDTIYNKPGLDIMKDQDKDNEKSMTLSIGPQHPGAGHMRIIVVLDGDIIVDAD
ncbi:MAG TPA: NADH-quinone oxidoreductase subunit D, partial [Nitrososphaeraceae archaeon]|nr:NADH-quinone oxidoreductase subunit D [Nitrososphaeraceae archaeon]